MILTKNISRLDNTRGTSVGQEEDFSQKTPCKVRRIRYDSTVIKPSSAAQTLDIVL